MEDEEPFQKPGRFQFPTILCRPRAQLSLPRRGGHPLKCCAAGLTTLRRRGGGELGPPRPAEPTVSNAQSWDTTISISIFGENPYCWIVLILLTCVYYRGREEGCDS